MKKKILLLTGLLLVMSAVNYSAPKNSLKDNLNAIEGKFNALLERKLKESVKWRHRRHSSRQKLLS